MLEARGHGRLIVGMTVRADQRAPVIRTCVGCKERAVKTSLLRLVAVGDNILPDPQARLPGRGAYLHPRQACLELACRRRAFPRALRTERPLGVAELSEFIAPLSA